MKTIKIYLAAFVLTLCISYVDSQAARVDKTLLPYKLRFEKMNGQSCNISIKFSTFKSPVIGVCVPGKKQIGIDKATFMNYSEIQRTALIFHEMGHCCLNLSHYGNMGKDMCPTELMYPYMPSELCLNKKWNIYMEKLFKKRE